MVAHFSGKVYPDLTFSIGIVPPKKKRLEDSLYDKDIEDIYDSYDEYYNKYGCTKKRVVQFLTKPGDCGRFIKGNESSRKVKRYGSKGITRYGKKSVSCFGAILQERYRNACTGFGTATVPAFHPRVLYAIGERWGEITRRFFQKLRRSCERKGKAFIYYGVTEIQEKRYKSYGIPVPHLHFAYVCRDNRGSEFYFTASQARRFWQESITESVARLDVAYEGESISFQASIDLQIVKKSVSAYMGKYLTKGVKVCDKMIEDGYEEMMPKQWWFACMQMKKWLKFATIRMTQDMCASFFHGIENLLHGCKVRWCNFVDVETEPGRYVIFGLVGRLYNDYYSELRREWDELQAGLGHTASG